MEYLSETLEEVQKLAVKDFELPVSALTFNVVKETKGFLGIGAKLEVEVDVALDGIEEGKKYIQLILDNNGVKGFIEKKVRGNNVEFNVDATTGKLDNTNNATWAQFNQGATVSFKVKAGATVTVTTNGNAAISYTIGSAAAVNATTKTTTFDVAADSTIVLPHVDFPGGSAVKNPPAV